MHIAPLSPDDPSELNGYELLGRIGQGGMGGDFQGSRQRPDRGPNQQEAEAVPLRSEGRP
ncbi:hypothetical protein GCM10022285_12290 [Streptomyces tunisiensis]|uniref:Serine/threonine protein kinase n=1 Tax=Streptomyces tunisiensis TaxID=948699 RepID=A0ABP7XX51_9ACTN